MAALQEAELLEVIVDAGESGKNLVRPGMQRLLNLVERRCIDAVIIVKLDRLTRSVKDLSSLLELFERRSVHLLSVVESLDTGSAAGRLIMNILASLSQAEREIVGERTRDALAHKKANMQFVGNTCYGFRCRDGKTVEPDPNEQRVRKTITRLREQGQSLRQIAAYLNKAGRFTRRGTPWRHDGVARVLKAA